MKAGAQLEGKDNKGLTPAGCAKDKGHEVWFQRLLEDNRIEKSSFNRVGSLPLPLRHWSFGENISKTFFLPKNHRNQGRR